MNGYVLNTITNTVDDTTAINVELGQRLISIKGRSIQSPTWGFNVSVNTWSGGAVRKYSISKYGIRNGRSVSLWNVLPYVPTLQGTPTAVGELQIQVIATTGCDAEVMMTNGTVFQ